MKCSCLSVMLVYATQCTANCVVLVILIGSLLTNWLMIYVPAEVMPASVFERYTTELQDRAVGQSSTSGRVPYSFGWIVSPATRDCLDITGSRGVSCLSSLR